MTTAYFYKVKFHPIFMVFCRLWAVVTLWDLQFTWKMFFFNLSIYVMVLRYILVFPGKKKMIKRAKKSEI